MPSSTQTQPNYARRIKLLGIGIFIFGLLYTGAWFFGASRLKDELSGALVRMENTSQTAKCANLDVRGYPFRVGVFCDGIAFDDPGQGVSLKAGAMRSAAQVYNPMQGVVELDGPFTLSLPGNDVVEANWTLLHASAKAAKPLPQRASLEIKDLVLSLPAQFERPFAQAKNVQLHLRTVEQDVQLAASLSETRIDSLITGGRDIPGFDFGADIEVKNGVALAQSGVRDIVKLLPGQSGTIRAMSLSFGAGGGVTVSGPVAFDAGGLMNADLSISFKDAAKLGQTLEKAVPELAAYVAPSLSLTASTAKPGEDPKIDITIRKGRAAIGIIPLGQVPAIQ